MSRSRTAAALLLPLLAACAAVHTPAQSAERPASLDATLQPYLTPYALPALAAAVVQNGRIVAVGAVGTRRAGEQIPVTVNDPFHIGSDTKAMTALLAAMFVEAGTLRWSSTVGEVFPEMAATMDPAFRQVTLEQLLSHTSGLPSDNDAVETLLNEANARPGNLDEMRYWLVTQWCTHPLEAPAGTRFAYSNLGYTIAGAMLERVGGRTWEELVQVRVFDPLGLASAGFGPNARLGKVDAPLGHESHDGALKPMLAGPNGDNPPILGPAGTVHLSVLDFANWAGWNAGEGARGPVLVQPETLRKLHTPVIALPPRPDARPGTPSRGQYGLGWGQVTLAWSPEPFIFHGGSNEQNLAYIMLQPVHDFAMVLMTNVSGPQADAALNALAQALYGRFRPGASSARA